MTADWARLLDSAAALVSALAWPLALVLSVRLVIRRHRAAFERLVDRVKVVTYPGGQIDLAVIEASQEAQVEELAERLTRAEADDAERLRAARLIVGRAVELGRLREATWWGAKYRG
ncbi:hypothetical protein [Nonomuraea endophytica]|uniref:Uncharacterized protein n=1 Tax=Nonomuraea endophytica TaxID=714136 RepID=A0A7W8EMS8_9ACTN|nr:hypothetical protein [Nonomuraea endophytica]MBB5084986.1 hypothetical protein [Nonomuraea endophytica]